MDGVFVIRHGWPAWILGALVMLMTKLAPNVITDRKGCPNLTGLPCSNRNEMEQSSFSPAVFVYLGFCFGIAAHFLDRNIFRCGERADVVVVVVWVGGTDGEHFSPQDIIYKPISLHCD